MEGVEGMGVGMGVGMAAHTGAHRSMLTMGQSEKERDFSFFVLWLLLL